MSSIHISRKINSSQTKPFPGQNQANSSPRAGIRISEPCALRSALWIYNPTQFSYRLHPTEKAQITDPQRGGSHGSAKSYT
jgi:hypothetical protein